MKKAFIRCLWGDFDKDKDGFSARRYKIEMDIKYVINQENNNVKFITYVLGE